MSVRDGMLAILTLGPAYGSQLHAELTDRTPHRAPVNVGQIYTTIDRLTVQKLIAPAGVNADSLPLHELTAKGTSRATDWMSRPAPSTTFDWIEMLDQVLITSSVDETSARRLIAGYRAMWLLRAEGPTESSAVDAHLALVAQQQLARSAVAWLDTVRDTMVDLPVARPFSDGRPRRGRPSGRSGGSPSSA